MAIRLSFVLLLLALTLVVESSPLSGDAYWGLPHLGGGDLPSSLGGAGDGFVASQACNDVGGECIGDTEISRRGLYNRKYISYEALKKNMVPCNKRGSSYYNCQRATTANPYRRGCSVQTQCYRNTK